MTYDSLPTNISDRNVQFYVHNGLVRWWNGKVLCCVHEKQTYNVFHTEENTSKNTEKTTKRKSKNTEKTTKRKS